MALTLDKIREFQGYDLLYPFTEGSVAILSDFSRFRSHATWPGGANDPTWVAGSGVGRALDFDSATPQYLQVTSPQLNYTFQAFSMVVRANPNTLVAPGNVPLMRGLLNTDGWYMSFLETFCVQVVTNQAAAFQESRSGAVLTVNTWQTVGISRTGASIRVFHNGLDATLTVGTHINPATSARTLKVGVWDDLASVPFNGQMEFIGVWGRALSAQEHMALHRMLS
jgi:hypothetical protein